MDASGSRSRQHRQHSERALQQQHHRDQESFPLGLGVIDRSLIDRAQKQRLLWYSRGGPWRRRRRPQSIDVTIDDADKSRSVARAQSSRRRNARSRSPASDFGGEHLGRQSDSERSVDDDDDDRSGVGDRVNRRY